MKVCVGLTGVLLAGCGPSPEKLLEQINTGDAAQALNTLESQLATKPTPALKLLAAHARLQACAARDCVNGVSGTLPSFLQPVGALLEEVKEPVALGEELPTLTSQSIITSATLAFAALPQQPEALLILRQALPADRASSQLPSLVMVPLTNARQNNWAAAAGQLRVLDGTTALPASLRFSAGWVAGNLARDEAFMESRGAALLAIQDTPPGSEAAMALLPHMLRHSLGSGPAALEALGPLLHSSSTLARLANPASQQAVAAELATLGTTDTLQTPWDENWQAHNGPVALALQRTSLNLNPNQPLLWPVYLNALISATTNNLPVPELSLSGSFDAGNISVPNQRLLGENLLNAAQKVQSRPGTAAPLLLLASQLKLASAQQTALDKLGQTLLLKAAAARDVTATMALAQARPEAARNNRQQVMPLLLEHIRNSLRAGRFTQAVSTSVLINTGLGLEFDLTPLMLEELTYSLEKNGTLKALNAPSPTALLQPQEDVSQELGALWDFMTDYFAAQPDVLGSQLNGLVAGATGTYGAPTAMYKLQHHYPAGEEAAHAAWMNRALPSAVENDRALTPAAKVTLIGQLAQVHQGLPMASMLESALAQSAGLEESRDIWEQAPANVRSLLKVIRPQFAALMRGQDAIAAGQPDAAIAAFETLTENPWLTQAQPSLQVLQERLLDVGGLYLPLSAAPDGALAAIWLNPLGLQGGKLNDVQVTFLNRLGTVAFTNPTTLVSTPALTEQSRLIIPFRFADSSLALTPAVLASSAVGANLTKRYGPISKLKIQANGTLLEAHFSNGRTLQLARVLNDATTPLRPDGQYALSTPLEQTLTPQAKGGEGILPPSSILTLQTAPSTQPASPAYGLSGEVYPLLGTLQHPAKNSPISFTGEYDAATLTSSFIFSYPLAESGQLVKAAVKCQSLAGPLTCGAHHLHSPRLAYASLIRGLQTQESLKEAASERTQANAAARAALTEAATAALASKVAVTPERSDESISSTQPAQDDAEEVSPTQPTATRLQFKAPVIASSPTDILEEESETPKEAETPKPTSVTLSTTDSTTVVPAGVFIRRVSGKVTPSPSTPILPSPTVPTPR